jgi:EAL domain-containing protein (putative c-di-GMP-specific phosphodiesterase class I)
MGCGYAQGYLFARPLDAEAAGALVRERRVWRFDLAQEPAA